MIETKQCNGRDIVPGDFGLSNCYLFWGNTASADLVQFNFLVHRDRASSSGRTGRLQ
jgi:hypothetical protein